MNRIVLITCWMCLALCCRAQSFGGLTGIPDTSYSLYSAYRQTMKEHPYITLPRLSASKSVAEHKELVYCNRNGRELRLDAFVPKGKTRNRIAVVFVHGGGWRTGHRNQHYELARSLAARGYVVFTPEYRLSTEALYPAAVHDLKAALRWVHANASTYGVDTNRIAVGGFSAGGQLAALLGTTNNKPAFEGEGCTPGSSRVAAILDLDGIVAFIHPESGEGDDSKKISAATNWFGYSKAERPDLWKQASALTHAGRHTPPTLFVNSSVDRMHAGRDDYRKVLAYYGVYSEVQGFAGAPHAFPMFRPWFDSTVHYIDAFLQKVLVQKPVASKLVVAQDGSGQFRSVQAALNAVPAGNSRPLTIFVKAGVYREKLWLDSTKSFVTMVGEDAATTVLSYNDHTGGLSPDGVAINTNTSQSFLQEANDFTARNITFRNDAGFNAGQAVAVNIRGDRNRFFNCRFVGFQDVLFPSKPYTRQYFEGCYIEGTTDFIFGPSTAWFEQCHIHSKKNSHVTAASTPADVAYGYVFNSCRLTGDDTLRSVSLGRPWRPTAAVTYLRCQMGAHILPEGWNNWKNPANETTARYAEYGSTGPGGRTDGRVRWARQLSVTEAAAIRPAKVLGGWKAGR